MQPLLALRDDFPGEKMAEQGSRRNTFSQPIPRLQSSKREMSDASNECRLGRNLHPIHSEQQSAIVNDP